MSEHEDAPEDTAGDTAGDTATGSTAGDMGVSSERVGPTGPGQVATDGVRPTAPVDVDDADAPPEQRPGNPETNPEGLAPKAGYSSKDPRSDD